MKRWNDILLDPNQLAYLLQETSSGRIVGVIVLEVSPDREDARFGVFVISKNYQGKKLGQILINHVEQIARKLLKKFMRIEVFTFAHKLEVYYQNLGYSYTGKTNSFFHAGCIKHEYRNKFSHYLKEFEKNLNKRKVNVL